MSIVLTGINHKTAPIALREQLAIPASEMIEASRALCAHSGIRECMILSTCNRVEFLTCQEPDAAPLPGFFESYFHVDRRSLQGHLYEHRDSEAVRHLFRVASSLDSMVVGEPQVLGQVKDAYLAGRAAGTVSSQLDRLLQKTFAVAKRVRRETSIGGFSVSIASVAVDLARKIFGSLEQKTVLLVGAGQMSELAARHLVQQGAGAVFVANRTHGRAEDLAREFHGTAIRFDELESTADRADIIITSTGAPHAIFRKEQARRFLERRRGRPMFFIDIGVPRDVDPEVNRLDGIFVYDIDDLESVASANMAERGKAATVAETMILEEVADFERRLQVVNVTPAILLLQRFAEDLREAELRRMEHRLAPLTPEQQAAVDGLTRSLTAKFLHHPLDAIKKAAREGNEEAVEVICQAFGLHLDGPCEALEAGEEPKHFLDDDSLELQDSGPSGDRTTQ